MLEVEGMQGMQAMMTQAQAAGVPTQSIADAGRTEVDPGTVTCAAFGPGTESVINGVTGHLSLLK